MSASREKKQRQDGTGDLTPRQRRDLKEAKAAKRNKILYAATGVVAVVLVAGLLLWDSGIFRGDPIAATVNGTNYTTSQLAYYYGNARQQQIQYASIYQQFGMAGYDSTKLASEQIQDETTGKTFASFFEEEALATLKQTVLLSEQAAAEGYALSDEGKQSVKDQIRNIQTYAAQSGMSESSYLKSMFGKYMDKKTLEAELTRATLASEYSTHKTESFTYTDEELTSYYEENANTLDTYDYHYVRIDGAPAVKTDAEGTEVEATEAEKSAAMSQAKIKAEALSNDLKGGAAFNTAAAKYVSDEEKSVFLDDPTHNHQTNDLGSSLTSPPYGQWLTSTETPRKAGDIGVVEDVSGSCYYVVQLVNRWRAEDTYASVDARHILIRAELDEGADAPTDAQYEAAKAKIDALKAEWESGAKTAESFGDLAKANSEDTGSAEDGGLIKSITPGQTVPEFDAFLFTPQRQVGEVGVVKNAESGMQGYHLIYIDALGEIAWKGTALNALRSAAYTEWYTGIDATYQADIINEGMYLLSK